MPVSIHGKQYNTVAERIAKAGDDLIEVNTLVLFTDPVVIKAIIKTNKGTFTGISAANASKSIEKESPYEVAETSAVGRALAFAGYETTLGIASAEEMIKLDKKPDHQDNEFKNSSCQKCGGRIAISQSGKPYCTNRCWLPENKHFIEKFKSSETYGTEGITYTKE